MGKIRMVVAALQIIMPKLKFVCPGRMNMSREGQAMCLGANSIFAGDKLLPLPDVNDDMEMFEMLGLTPQNHLQKFLSLLQLTAALNLPLLEKNKMVKTGHTIDRES
jgi:biotin synthase